MNFALLNQRIDDIESNIVNNESLKDSLNKAIDTVKQLVESCHNCFIVSNSDTKLAVKLENVIIDNYNTMVKNYGIDDDKDFLIDAAGKDEEKYSSLKQIEIMLKKLKKSIDE